MRFDLSKLVEAADRAKVLMQRNSNGSPRGWQYNFKNQGSDRTEIMLYDMIGDWGVTASDFRMQLNQVTTPNIDVRINSDGGDVFDAISIYSALQSHQADVTTWVDGLAASAASFVAQAGNMRMIGKPAKMMIHNASGLVYGQASDMRQMADVLDEISSTIAQTYADRSGKPVSNWVDAMNQETWYSAQSAVDSGLADTIDQPDQTQNSAATIRVANNVKSQTIKARARVNLRGK